MSRQERAFRAKILPSTLSRTTAVIVVAALASACGLSLSIGEAPSTAPVEEAGADTSLPAEPRPEAAVPASDAELPDTSVDVDATPDAACSPLVSESFTSGPGPLVLLGQAKVESGRLEILSETLALGVQGAAYFTVPTGLARFTVSFTLSTGALSSVYLTSDGFAFNWLEKAVPARPSLGSGNDLGMTLEPPGQHGQGLLFDIYPPVSEDRYVSDNELGPNTRYVREKFVSFATGGPTQFAFKIRVGAGLVEYDVSSPLGSYKKTLSRGAAGTLYRTFFFSASAGAARSPGMFLDDLVISTCP